MASYERMVTTGLCIALAWHSLRLGYPVQAIVTFLLCIALRKDPHFVALMAMPMVLLAERCLQTKMSLGHSPLSFYAACLASYAMSFPSSSSWPLWQWGAAAMAAGGFLFALTGGWRVGVAIGAHLLVAGIIFVACSGNRQSPPNAAKKKLGYVSLLPRREAVLVASWIGFLVLDLTTNSTLEVDTGSSMPAASNGEAPVARTLMSQLRTVSITSFPHVAARGSMLCAAAVAYVSFLTRQHVSDQRLRLVGGSTTVFLGITAVCAASAYFSVQWIMNEAPAVWLWAFISSKPLRLQALLLWFTGIPIGTLLIRIFGDRLPSVIRRKLYHGMAVVAFGPIFVLDPNFMALCMAVAVSLSVILETGRLFGICGSVTLTRFLESQVDSRDMVGDTLIVRTHTYLMLGFGVASILFSRSELLLSRPTPGVLAVAIHLVPGVVALGILDSWAAVGGTLWTARRHRQKLPVVSLAKRWCGLWFPEVENPSLKHKTSAGFVIGLGAAIVSWILLLVTLFTLREGFAASWGQALWSTWTWMGVTALALASVFECVCGGIDNLELPLITYAALLAGSVFVYS